MTISKTKEWFELAVATPTEKNQTVQLGVHFEEVAEMMDALGLHDEASSMHDLATRLKTGVLSVSDLKVDRKELLDALCDQLVTATGVAHMFDLKIDIALDQVNASNFSKFVDGKPVFDSNGKIAKGPSYFKPNLGGLY